MFRTDEIRHMIEIVDLVPATGYTARVAGGNQADLSSYSTPVEFTTTEEGNKDLYHSLPLFKRYLKLSFNLLLSWLVIKVH